MQLCRCDTAMSIHPPRSRPPHRPKSTTMMRVVTVLVLVLALVLVLVLVPVLELVLVRVRVLVLVLVPVLVLVQVMVARPLQRCALSTLAHPMPRQQA